MPSPTQEHLSRTIRLERIRSKYADFGIATDTQLWELVRDEAQSSSSAIAEKESSEIGDISQWSDDQFRQCMVVRGNKRYRTFIDLVCQVFAGLDVSSIPADERCRYYAQWIWALEHTQTADSPPLVSSKVAEFDEFPFVRQRITDSNPADADKFYNAVPQGLAAITSNLDIVRDIYRGEMGFRKAVFESLEADAPRITILSGTAGSGKTILLDRVTVEVIRAGYEVAKCNTAILDPNTVFSTLLEIKQKSHVPLLFIFDDCYRMLARGVKIQEFLQIDLATAPGPSAAIVLSDNWYIRSEGKYLFSESIDDRRSVHSVVELSQSEIEILVDKLYAAEQSGTIKEVRCTLPKQQRLNLLASQRDRLAIIALLKLRYGKGITEIVREEYDSIEPTALREGYRDAVILNAVGTGMPTHLLRRRLTDRSVDPGITRAIAALFTHTEDGIHIRHSALIPPLLGAIYPEAGDRSLALSSIVRSLNLDNAADREFWLWLATRPGVAKSIFRLFSHNKEVMRGFVDDMHTQEERFLEADLGASLFGFLGTIYKDVLFDLERGLSQFVESHQIDGFSPYVLRQLAWTTLKLGRLELAEAYCREAVSKWPDDAQTLSEAAFIMSWCSRAGFDEADGFYAKAAELAPDDEAIARKRERYKEAAVVSQVMVGEHLPDVVLEEIGAPWFIWRVRRHARKQYTRALFRELQGNLRREQIDLEEVDELVTSAKGVADRRLSGLLRANIARAEYERWYRFGGSINLAEVKARFESAIERCPNDPFIHCWFGTFLKEVEIDYDAAEREYEKARELAKGARAEHIVEHPMILNNLALLIMDGIYRQLRRPEQLKEAHKLLRKAIQRMGETGFEFRWPVHTMERLRQQAIELKIDIPKDK